MYRLLQNELIYGLLEGGAEEGQIKGFMAQYALSMRSDQWCAAVIEIDDVNWKLNKYTPEERKEITRKLMSSISAYLHRLGIGIWGRTAEHRMAAILCMSHSEAQTTLQTLIEHVKQNHPLSVTIGLGSTETDLRDIHRSYNQAVEALGCKMFIGKGKVLAARETMQEPAMDAAQLDDVLSRLFPCIMTYDLVGIVDRLEELFELVRATENHMTVYNVCIQILSGLDMSLRTVKGSLHELLGREYKQLDVLLQFETISDIEAWTRRTLFEISELHVMREGRRQSKLIAQMQQYVHEHLDSKITLREIANVFAFSPNYLGALFKECTGISFSDYLIRSRMERAKQLLQDPTLRIYEVSNQLGYSNMTYFHRQFKGEIGLTPSEYRKRS
ncbi:helix-turn-helix domain-containing protein [Paenibacillus ferrarius]|uniref:helix-turn-helix domain-containing protein n=1 Tax=Paenibacillus ferrarius TaxID=1469647 RepID=UPI003D27A733